MSRRFRCHPVHSELISSSAFLTRAFVIRPRNHFHSVTYPDLEKTFRASEAPMHPQLRLMLGGAILVVQFGNAIAFCSRGSQSKCST
jgi:hypothetical protein